MEYDEAMDTSRHKVNADRNSAVGEPCTIVGGGAQRKLSRWAKCCDTLSRHLRRADKPFWIVAVKRFLVGAALRIAVERRVLVHNAQCESFEILAFRMVQADGMVDGMA